MDYRVWILPILLMLIIGGYYFGKKIIVLFSFKNKNQKLIYWGILYLVLTVILTRRSCLFIWIGYAVFFYFISDIICVICKKCSKEKLFEKLYYKGIPILVLSFLITVYGVNNACHPIVKEYIVELPVSSNYTIGMISDLHLGTIPKKNFLDEIVEKTNELDVDMFILVGDIFDEQTSLELKGEAYEKFSKIKTKYGIYYVEGNHDMLTNDVMEGFTSHGIKVLSDETVLINEQFYLIGRKDKRREKLGTPRIELKELVGEIKTDYPVILIDHQPEEQLIASNLGIDLQLSGHTHAGQVFPLNFFLQYGYKKEGNFQSIISSGYGAWGFPFRTAKRSEMVLIRIIKKEK